MAYIAMASSFLPIIFGVYRWRIISKSLRYFLFFSCVTVLQIVLEYLMGRMNIHTNLMSDIYRSIEITFMLLFFKSYLNNVKAERMLYLLLNIFYLIWVVSSFLSFDPNKINTVMGLTSRSILIIASIIVIYSLIENAHLSPVTITKHPSFWISSGVLIYCSGSFIVLGLGNEIMELGIDYFISMWFINWSFFIISNILYSRSFFAATR